MSASKKLKRKSLSWWTGSWKYSLSALSCLLILSACSTTRSVPVESPTIPDIPPSLTVACPPLPEYTSGKLADVVENHGNLVAAAQRCAARHKALTELLR